MMLAMASTGAWLLTLPGCEADVLRGAALQAEGGLGAAAALAVCAVCAVTAAACGLGAKACLGLCAEPQDDDEDGDGGASRGSASFGEDVEVRGSGGASESASAGGEGDDDVAANVDGDDGKGARRDGFHFAAPFASPVLRAVGMTAHGIGVDDAPAPARMLADRLFGGANHTPTLMVCGCMIPLVGAQQIGVGRVAAIYAFALAYLFDWWLGEAWGDCRTVLLPLAGLVASLGTLCVWLVVAGLLWLRRDAHAAWVADAPSLRSASVDAPLAVPWQPFLGAAVSPHAASTVHVTAACAVLVACVLHYLSLVGWWSASALGETAAAALAYAPLIGPVGVVAVEWASRSTRPVAHQALMCVVTLAALQLVAYACCEWGADSAAGWLLTRVLEVGMVTATGAAAAAPLWLVCDRPRGEM